MPDRLDQIKSECAQALADATRDFSEKKREIRRFFDLKARAVRHELAEKLIAERRKRDEKKHAARVAKKEFFEAISCYYGCVPSAVQRFRKKGITTAEGVHTYVNARELAKQEKLQEKQSRKKGNTIDPEIDAAIRRFHCCGGSKNNFYRVWARYRERGITTAEGIIAFNLARGRTGPGKPRIHARGPYKKNPPPGYDFLRNIFPLFNEARASVGRPPLVSPASLGSLLSAEKILPLDGYCGVYNVEHLLSLAKKPYHPRGSTRFNREKLPVASAEELASGQWLTIKEFASIASISYARAHNQAIRRNFHQRYHPVSNLYLIHAPTAAAYFLDLASKNASKK